MKLSLMPLSMALSLSIALSAVTFIFNCKSKEDHDRICLYNYEAIGIKNDGSCLVDPLQNLMDVLVLHFLYLPEVVDCLVDLLHCPRPGLYLAPLSTQFLQSAVLYLLLFVQLSQLQVVVVDERVVVLEFVELKAPDVMLLQYLLMHLPEQLQLLTQYAHVFFGLRGPALHLISVLLLHDVLSLGKNGFLLERDGLLLLRLSEPFEFSLKLGYQCLFVL